MQLELLSTIAAGLSQSSVGVRGDAGTVIINVARLRREDGGRISGDGHKRRRVSVPGAAGIGLPASPLPFPPAWMQTIADLS